MRKVSDLICIVDDDKSVRRALGRLVRSFGFEIHLFATGRDYLDASYVDNASCLIVDVMMPDIDGFELHAMLTASGRDIPTIFISGLIDQKTIERAQSVGGVAILFKPCGAELLRDAIEEAVAK